MTIGAWPDGKPFILFRAFEGKQKPLICWTPSKVEWRVIEQMLSALSLLGVSKL